MSRLTALLALILFVTLPALADDDHPRPFDAEVDAMAAVDSGIAEALASDRRLILVLGANWCHDSRAFAQYLGEAELAALIEQNYVLRHVDVGWRDRNHAVMNRFDVAAIYATPTVFIIDPEQEILLNRHSTETWTSAASSPISDVIAYFTRWTDASSDTDSLIAASVIYQSMLTEIEVFEAEEGERLAQAYIDIARWRALPEADRPEDFRARSREVEDWRRSMVAQVRRLRADAEQLVTEELALMADGGAITLDLIEGFDAGDPDLPLNMVPHQSDHW